MAVYGVPCHGAWPHGSCFPLYHINLPYTVASAPAVAEARVTLPD